MIKAGLNIGLSGVGYWTHCMGGFEHNADPELYIRWCQFGMMSPIAMVFGMDHPGYKEPWNYGDTALRIFKKYDSLRYSMLPYLYTYAWRQYKEGVPMMRALVMHYQDDPNVYNITDQYMLGEELMVCPVTTKGAQTRVVYLPKGNWYDFHTGKKLSGGQWLNIVTPLDILPMFVKEGSIIPRQPVMKYTDEKPVETLTLEIFPAEKGFFQMYQDDGKTLAYQQENYSTNHFHHYTFGKRWTIQIGRPSGKFKPATHNYLLKLRLNEPPAEIEINRRLVPLVAEKNILDNSPGMYFDAREKILYVKTVPTSEDDIIVSILFK